MSENLKGVYSPLISKKGGYAMFPGVELGGGKNYVSLEAELVSDSHITVTTEYVNDNIKRFEIDFSETDDKVIFSKIEKFWNDEKVAETAAEV